MKRVYVPASAAFLIAAYFLAPAGWFRPATPAVAAKAPVQTQVGDDDEEEYETEAAWRYRHGQVKHWRVLVINNN